MKNFRKSADHLNYVPLEWIKDALDKRINDLINGEEVDLLEVILDDFQNQLNKIEQGIILRLAVLESKIEARNSSFSHKPEQMSLDLNTQTVIDVVGCSNEIAELFIQDKEIMRKLRGHLLLAADDKIHELFTEFHSNLDLL
jgi:hypothetical protein